MADKFIPRREAFADWGHADKQRLLNPERNSVMPVRAFYGWLVMAACYGAVAAVVALIAAGKL